MAIDHVRTALERARAHARHDLESAARLLEATEETAQRQRDHIALLREQITAYDAVLADRPVPEAERAEGGGWKCCGGPHCSRPENPRGHAITCAHYGEGTPQERAIFGSQDPEVDRGDFFAANGRKG